jgi:maltose O-acetyltransferase
MDGLGHSQGRPMRSPRTAPPDPALTERLLAEFNAPTTSEAARSKLLERLLFSANGAVVRAPLSVESGRRIHFDEACFVGENCRLQDVADIHVGSFTQIAAGVTILTQDPPGTPAKPVRIGRNVWIGAGAVIHPGVTIGDDAIVGAGTTVSVNVPDGATIAGTPARIML